MSDSQVELLREINAEIKDVGHRVIKMETYQKTHWETLKDLKEKVDNMAHEEDLDNLEVRVRTNERTLARISVLSGLAYTAIAAWATDIASFFIKSGN